MILKRKGLKIDGIFLRNSRKNEPALPNFRSSYEDLVKTATLAQR